MFIDIKGANALEDKDSQNKYKKVFVSTAKKMYYVNDDNHIVSDEVALEISIIDGFSLLSYNFYDTGNKNLLSRIDKDHELTNYEIKYLKGDMPEELKEALFEQQNHFDADFQEQEPEDIPIEYDDTQPQIESENNNDNNESHEEPNEQQENQNTNNEGGLGMAEKKTKLIIGDDIKYVKNGDDHKKWYFEVPVSDKEIDGHPQWTKLYVRATDGAVFNNPELDEKVGEHPDRKRVQVVEEPTGKDPKEFVLKDDGSSSFCIENKSSGGDFLSDKIKEDKNYKNTGGYLSVFDPEMYSNKTDAVSCNAEHEKEFGGFKGTGNRYIIRGHKLKAKKMFDSGGAAENLFVTQDPELKVYKIDDNNKISPDGFIGKAREMKDFWSKLCKTGFFKLKFCVLPDAQPLTPKFHFAI